MTSQLPNPNPDYCFHGAYERAVDAKGRFNLPFRFRAGGGAAEDEKYIVTVGADGNLSIFPQQEWQVTFQGIKAESTETEWRARVRQISAQTFDITPDAQGRVSVPSVLLERVGITRRVKVIGMGNSMELWNPETFVADQKDLSEMDQDFMNKLF
jgi:MraZ protein